MTQTSKPKVTSSDLERDILAHRSHYPALANKTYFNYGGQGPLCQTALAAIADNYQHIESAGPFSVAANEWAVLETERLRQAIASELNVSPATITLTENTTVGCNIALWSVDWQQGDRLLLSDCEHPGIVALASQLRSRFGIEVAYFPLQDTLNSDLSDAAVLEMLDRYLLPRTRAIVINHICWNTGQVLPLHQISQMCHHRRVLVVVDAAQSVGVLPLDLAATEADFYAFTGHKWWGGPVGVGGLYVRTEAFAAMQPVFVGWRGITSATIGQPPVVQWRQDGQKFEVASSAYPLYGALKEAIACANRWGNQQQRYERICELSHFLWKALRQIPQITCLKHSAPAAGLVSFAIGGKNPIEVMKQLEAEHGIAIRSIPNPSCLRVSIHYLTTKTEINKLVSVLESY